MSDTQSIEDLIGKKTSEQGPKKLASERMPAEKFAERISDIRIKEKEVETARAAAAINIPIPTWRDSQ